MPRLILTLPQARVLHETAWPGPWAFLLPIALPNEPDNLPDPQRMQAGLRMMELGCQPDQIAEQLMWKPGCGVFRTLARLHRQRG